MTSEFIAYGGGLGSSTLILQHLKTIRAGDLEVVYVNHEADLPETHQYVRDIKEVLDINITQLKPGSLYDYCYEHRLIPSIHWRWCTDKFKIRPMKKYAGEDRPMIGLSYDERWRAHDFEFNGKASFPLIQNETTRYKAVKEFEDEDVPVPCKSGCFFCPFQSRLQWRNLWKNHPDLYLKAIQLEERARERNNKIWLFHGDPFKRTLRQLMKSFTEQTVLTSSHKKAT